MADESLQSRRWCAYMSLALILAILAPGHVQAGKRVYGKTPDGNYVRVAGNRKISPVVARHVQARDGFSPNDKRAVVTLVIPPELGGVSDFNNLRALTKKDAKLRRKVEKAVLRKVEEGEMSVGEARARIAYFQMPALH